MSSRFRTLLALVLVAPLLCWAQDGKVGDSNAVVSSALVPGDPPVASVACPHTCGAGCCQANQICHTGFRRAGENTKTCLDRPTQYEEQLKIREIIKKMKKTTHLPINMETVKDAAEKAGVRTTSRGMKRIEEVVQQVVSIDATEKAEERGQFSDARIEGAVRDALAAAGLNVSEKVVDDAREEVRKEQEEIVELKEKVVKMVDSEAVPTTKGVVGLGQKKVNLPVVMMNLEAAGLNISSEEVKKSMDKEIVILAARRGLRKACVERQLDTKSIYSAVQEALKKAEFSSDEHVMAQAMAAIRPMREHLLHQLVDFASQKAEPMAHALINVACGLRRFEESCSSRKDQSDCGNTYQECLIVANTTNPADSTAMCAGPDFQPNKTGTDLSPACLAAMGKACPGMGSKGQACFDCIHQHHTILASVCSGTHSGNEFCENSKTVNVTCSWHENRCVSRPTDLCPIVSIKVKDTAKDDDNQGANVTAPANANVNGTANATANATSDAPAYDAEATKDPATWAVLLSDKEILAVLDILDKAIESKEAAVKKLGKHLAKEAKEKNMNRRSQTATSLKARLISKIPLAREDPDLINTALNAAKTFIITSPPTAAVLKKKKDLHEYEQALNITAA